MSTYARNRNFLNGAVTHLSPYIRHGCLTLHEVFNYVKKQSNPLADRLLMQLAWRDYWRQVWFAEGDAIFSELEPPKAIIHHEPLSEDIIKGKTGLPCMDAFIRDLLTTGYVHNLSLIHIYYPLFALRHNADAFEGQNNRNNN